MKVFLFLIALLVPSLIFAQDLSQRELRSLKEFDISIDHLDTYDEIELLNLQAFLKSNKQYRRRKKTGIIMASAGALITGLGIAVIARNDADYEAKPFQNLVGGFIIATGAATGGLSIPFFCSSKKRKRERNEIIPNLRH